MKWLPKMDRQQYILAAAPGRNVPANIFNDLGPHMQLGYRTARAEQETL